MSGFNCRKFMTDRALPIPDVPRIQSSRRPIRLFHTFSTPGITYSIPSYRYGCVRKLFCFLMSCSAKICHDSTSFHESTTPALTQLQNEHWVPLIEWANQQFNTKIQIAGEGQLFIRQSPETVRALQRPIHDYDAYKLAGKAILFSEKSSKADLYPGHSIRTCGHGEQILHYRSRAP